jgi:hypothetical protein
MSALHCDARPAMLPIAYVGRWATLYSSRCLQAHTSTHQRVLLAEHVLLDNFCFKRLGGLALPTNTPSPPPLRPSQPVHELPKLAADQDLPALYSTCMADAICF